MKELLSSNSYSLVDNDKVIAVVSFEISGDELIILHTFVDDAYRGQGLAKKLMEKCDELSKKNKLRIKPVCSYAVKYFSHS